MKFKILFIALVCMTQVACQTLTVTLPGPNIESPVANGKGGNFDMELGYREAVGVKVVENGGARPLTNPNPRVYNTGELFAKGLMGLGSRFEASMSLAVPSSVLFTGKYQFMGSPRTERKEGDYLGAVYMALGNGQSSQSGNQAYEFGPGGYPWKAFASGNVFGFGASFGYQAAEWFLVYAGFSHYNYTMTYKVDQEASRDGTSPEAHYSGTQEGSADALGVGLEYGKKVMIGMTGQYSWKYWVNNPVNTNANGSIFVKFLFN